MPPFTARDESRVELTAAPLPGAELHELLAAARRTPGLTAAELVGQPALLVSRFADLKAFLADDAGFPGGLAYRYNIEPVVGPTFISMDGADHNRTRQLTMPAFRSRAVQRFADDALVPLAHEIVDRFAGRGEADLVAELTDVLPFAAISRKVGLPAGSESRQRELARAMLSYPTSPEVARAAAAEVARLVDPVVDERLTEPTDDFVSQLLSAEHDGLRLDREQVRSHLLLLYAVGATTTADAMSSMFRTLLDRPDLVERARSEPALRPRIVHEALRFEPPVAILPRVAAAGGPVGGVDVPAGTVILAALAGANRDPEVFAEPDRFDPDRDEHEILTFGFGAKFCPGSHLARRQLLAALEVAVDRLPGLRLVEGDEPTGAILRSVRRLRVAWDA